MNLQLTLYAQLLVRDITVKVIHGNNAVMVTVKAGITWNEFLERVRNEIEVDDDDKINLGYKITPRDPKSGQYTRLKSEGDFRTAMDAVINLMERAKTRSYMLEVQQEVRPKDTRLFVFLLIPVTAKTRSAQAENTCTQTQGT